MVEQHKKALEKQLWNIANTLRGNMSADEFRDYILGFIFYKYLSERMDIYADELLKEDGIKFDGIDESTDEGKEYLAAIQEEAIDHLGYFLKPTELFHVLAQKGASGDFILETLSEVLNHIEQSTMGTASEDDFNGLFDDLDLTSNKLGKTEKAKNELISKILVHLDDIDFLHHETEIDILGDAYEYLIGQFASGAGKKAGEFYTPPMVSKLLAKLVTQGKDKLKSVYDPTCGSGSLLLRVAKEVNEVGSYYGQESNPSTYNLARMNMILHGVHYRQFDIQQDDTLEQPHHIEERFEAVVANPPFSADWSASSLFSSDARFSGVSKLAPKSKADLAFVQHMIYQLADDGIMAVVLPHGALSRPSAEAEIRKYLIDNLNYLDGVIGLPANLFYGTETPTCILVFRKDRKVSDNIIFIDSSAHFERTVKKNFITDEHINDIYEAYISRKTVDRYSKSISLSDIKKQGFNLNIRRYVDTFKGQPKVRLDNSLKSISLIESELSKINQTIDSYLKDLNVDTVSEDIFEKIYQRSLRFKDNKGCEYKEWGFESLGKLVVKVNTKNADEKIRTVLTNSARLGIVKQSDYFDKDIANQENIGGYYVVEKDDFVYNPRTSELAPVGPIKRNKLETGVMSPLYSVFRFKSKELVDFYEIFFSTSTWHKYLYSVANYGARHDRMNIRKEDFFSLPMPIVDEQEALKISGLYQALHKKSKLLDSYTQKFNIMKTAIGQQLFYEKGV